MKVYAGRMITKEDTTMLAYKNRTAITLTALDNITVKKFLDDGERINLQLQAHDGKKL